MGSLTRTRTCRIWKSAEICEPVFCCEKNNEIFNLAIWVECHRGGQKLYVASKWPSQPSPKSARAPDQDFAPVFGKTLWPLLQFFLKHRKLMKWLDFRLCESPALHLVSGLGCPKEKVKGWRQQWMICRCSLQTGWLINDGASPIEESIGV